MDSAEAVCIFGGIAVFIFAVSLYDKKVPFRQNLASLFMFGIGVALMIMSAFV